MMNRIAINFAAKQLAKSETGRDALQHLLLWFRDGRGLNLDGINKRAVLQLIAGVWERPGTGLEEIEASLR